MRIKKGNPRSQNGLALIIILWMLILLTIMAASYSGVMRTETKLTAHQVQTAQARVLAEAGIWLALTELLRPQLERSWPTNGNSQIIEFKDGKIEISIQDEAGKIDLNTARAELLQSLLQSAELTGEDGKFLLDAILDWRDRDDLKRAFGAEDDDYQTAGVEHGAKDGPFNSVDELRLILGMTESIFQAIRPALTIHSHQAGINPEVAPKETLMAIPGITTETVEQVLNERKSDTKAEGFLGGIDNRFFTRTKERTFTITSEGISSDSKLKLEAVVLLKRNAKPPFSVLSWWEAKQTKYDEQKTNE